MNQPDDVFLQRMDELMGTRHRRQPGKPFRVRKQQRTEARKANTEK